MYVLKPHTLVCGCLGISLIFRAYSSVEHARVLESYGNPLMRGGCHHFL